MQLLASNVSTANANNKQKKKHKKKRQSGGTMPTVPVKFLDADGQEISQNLAVGEALMDTRSLQVGAETFVVLHNQPIVTKLQVLEPVLAGISVNPLRQTEFCAADECSWRWFRLGESSRTLVSTERKYTPIEEDIGCVECHAPTMKSEFAEASKAEVVTTTILSGPNRDVFKDRQRMGASSAIDKYPESEAFRVMSYNILYDGYATTEHAKKNLFSYVDDCFMKETRRIQLIFQ